MKTRLVLKVLLITTLMLDANAVRNSLVVKQHETAVPGLYAVQAVPGSYIAVPVAVPATGPKARETGLNVASAETGAGHASGIPDEPLLLSIFAIVLFIMIGLGWIRKKESTPPENSF